MDEEISRLESLLGWALDRVRVEGWRGPERAKWLWERIMAWRKRLDEIDSEG